MVLNQCLTFVSSQVLMLQPVTITERGPDGQTVQQTQYILQEPAPENSEVCATRSVEDTAKMCLRKSIQDFIFL